MRVPDWLEPMAATLTAERFAGPEWSFERKLDGIRLLAFKRGPSGRLLSRNRLPLTDRYPAVAAAHRRAAGRATPFSTARPPGAWGRQGRCRLPRLRRAVAERRDASPPCRSTSAAPCLRTSRSLAAGRAASRPLRGPAPWERACRAGWEGVIAKRRDSPYEHRRSPHWLKMKCEATQELVVGGFTDPQGSRVGLGALLVGYFEGDDFVFAGKVGTGFDTALLLDLRARLDALEIADAAVHRRAPACRASAPTGCGPRSSCRSPSPSGPCTASCAIRACSACATTRRRATWCEGAAVPSPTPRRCCSRTTASPRASWPRYYEAVAPVMLPHLRRRPITMERFPNGIGAKGFIQKDVSKGFPEPG